MKQTTFSTWHDGKKIEGDEFTTVVKNCYTQTKLDNAIKRHLKKLNSMESKYPNLKQNIQIKYESIYL
jgi:hypothetical protein